MTTETQLPDSPEVNEGGKPIDWVEILTVLWSSRKLIAYVAGAADILCAFGLSVGGTWVWSRNRWRVGGAANRGTLIEGQF